MKKRTVTAMFFSLMLLSVLIIALLGKGRKEEKYSAGGIRNAQRDQ